MTTWNDLPPQEQVALLFMERKGYYVAPKDIQKVEGQPCWYFLYELPEGVLELEVSWNGEWRTMVSTFSVRDAKGSRPLQF